MKLLGLDHSQLNVKGGHPPHFYRLKSEMLPLGNLLVCPRNTPKDKTLFDQRSYSQHGTMWKHTEKSADNTASTENLSCEISGLIRSESPTEIVLQAGWPGTIKGQSMKLLRRTEMMHGYQFSSLNVTFLPSK